MNEAIKKQLENINEREKKQARQKMPDKKLPLLKSGMSFGEILKLELPKRVEIIIGLARGEIGLVNAVTNVGKTTLFRNLALSLILGKKFLPLITSENKPYRVAILDFEDSLEFFRSDILEMSANFSSEEKQLINENLFLFCDATFEIEGLKLNKDDHFEHIRNSLNEIKPDVIFIDTISAGFSIRNENDNSEVKESVMKVLQKLAKYTNAVVLASHHIGKAKLEESSTKERSHKGRGASSFSDSSRVIINLEKSSNDDVILACAKIKGKPFSDVILKQNNRWFSIQGSYETLDNYQLVMKIFDDGKPYKKREIDDLLKGKMSSKTVSRQLNMAITNGFLTKENSLFIKNGQIDTH